MPRLDILVGQPTYDLDAIMLDVFAHGTLSGGGNTMTLTSGNVTLTITGSGLAGGGRSLTAGTITELSVSKGGVDVADLHYDGALGGFQSLQAALGVFDNAPSNDAAFDALGSVLYVTDTEIFGSDDVDEIFGSTQFETQINANGGNDIIHGGDGGTSANLGDGDDTYIGGLGDDFVEGGAGDDTMDGGTGYGYDNVEYRNATAGITVNKTSQLNGTVTGNASVGSDTFTNFEIVVGSNYADTFNGSSQRDDFTGNGGADTFNGGLGRDRVIYEKEKNNHNGIGVDLGSANNGVAVNLSAVAVAVTAAQHSGGVAITLAAGTARDTFGSIDHLNSIEMVRGTDKNDFFQGGDGDEDFQGEGGNDTINAGGGNDFILAGAGDDKIDGGAGKDVLSYDDLNIAGVVGVTVTKLALATSGTVTGGGFGTDSFTNIEVVRGSHLNDTFNGNTGNDVFVGDAGDDTFNGGAGIDTVDYSYEEGNEGSTNGIGINLGAVASQGIAANRGFDLYGNQDSFNAIENIIGSNRGDTIIGSAVDNVIEGRDGRDFLLGGAGNDTLLGGNDNDALVGGAGNDILNGGNGDSDIVSYFDETGTLGAKVNLNTGVATDTFGNTDTLISIEEVLGSQRADIFTAKANDYSGFRGLNGADTFNGGGDTWVYYGQDAGFGGGQRVVINLSGGTITNAGLENGAGVTLAAGKAKDGFGAIDTLNNIHKIRGTALNDWVMGSEGREHFQMQAGDDIIDGAGGDDMVDYSHDRDEVDGAELHGVIVNLSNTALATMNIGFGQFTVAAGTAVGSFAGVNHLSGPGSFTDTDTLRNIEQVRGTDYNDYIVGSDGNDEFDARGGNDTVLAGGGDFDFINGGSGNDVIDGQAGYDMISFGGNNSDDELAVALSGADGTGTAIGLKDGQAVNTQFLNVEAFKGTGGDDTFTAQIGFGNTNDSNSFNDQIRGFQVTGLAGNDTYTDLTTPAHGYGSLLVNYDEEKFDHDGFDGNWNGSSAGEVGVKVNLSDTVHDGLATGTARDTFGDIDTINGVRQFYLTDTGDSFWGREDGSNVFVDARTGDDTITTFGGNDVVWGGEGNDTISTGDGDDNVDGWDGNDTINTGAGDDWIGAGWGDDTIDGGAGRDGLGYDGSSITDSYAGLTVALNGANGSGTIAGAVTFRGGNNELHSGSVNGTTFANLEEIQGSNAADRFTVSAGFTNTADANRVVYDDRGDTRGQQGAFFVTGNKGNDVFTDDTDSTVRGDSGGTLIVSYRNEQYGRGHDGYWGNDPGERGVIVNLSGHAVSTTDFALNGAVDVPASIAAHTALDTYGNIDTLNKVQMVDLTNGADWLFGDDNRDTFANGMGGNDVIRGGGGDDTITGGQGDDTLIGGAGNDALVYAYEEGWDGADEIGVYVNLSATTRTFAAADGNVVVAGGHAQDLFGDTDTISEFEIVAGTGLDDFIVADDSGMHLLGLGGDDHLEGGAGDDVLRGGSGADIIDGKDGSDWLDYGLEYDLHGASDPAPVGGVAVDLMAGTATDTFGDIDTISNVENVYGTVANDTMIGDNEANIFVSGGGIDTLTGNGGDDTFVYTTGQVTVTDFTPGSDILDLGRVQASSSVASFALLLGFLVDTANTTDAVFDFGSGNTLTLLGVDWNSLGVDDFILNAVPVISGSVIFTNAENIAAAVADINATDANGDTLTYSISGGPDQAKFAIDAATGVIRFLVAPDFENPTDVDGDNSYEIIVSVDDGIGGITTQPVTISVSNLAGITYNGTAANNVASGTGEEDILNGMAGNDTLSGLGGNDRLDGGAGTDTMIGGTGDDTYIVDVATDVVTEKVNEGNDTIITGLATYSLAGAAGRLNVENLTFTGAGAHVGTGNDLANIITGNIGADTLSGGNGDDTLIGGAGNDILTGGAGADTLIGGADNDTYVVDGSDTIVELANQGTDTVQSAATFSLVGIANVENLTLTGVAAINGTGNELDNVLVGNGAANILIGNGGNDTLNGGVGADTMIGGLGDDTYVVDNLNDTVTEAADEGIDTIQTALINYTLDTAGRAEVENLTLTAAIVSGTLTGNARDNVLTATGNGNLTLTGLAGDDIYVIGGTGTKTIVEADAGGNDTVRSSVSYTLAANVENLELTGAVAINGTGNAGDNTITGNSAANILDGKGGADTLIGGNGADTYIIDSASDLVDETTSTLAAIDTVQSTVSVDLSDNLRFKGDIENVTLLAGAGAANVVGNGLANVILGNASDNTLDGGAGGDTLRGGAGNDTYIVDDANDIVDETANAGAGTDKVFASVSFSLANVARAIGTIENLELTGTNNINATGNAVANELIGNSGNNTLDGGALGDTMRGRAGDDIYIVDSAADRVDERSLADGDAGGNDTVRSSVSFDLQSGQVLGGDIENVTLTGAAAINAYGNAGANILTGNAAANVLDGRVGADTMIGGDGADTYYVDDSSDLVIETNAAAAGGVDTVRSSVVSYTLQTNVENLVLVDGSAALNGTGNGLANAITGNAASNIIDGGAGNDTMTGLGGNDTYIVDSTGDVIIEQLNGGTDTVRTSANFTLGLNVENLTIVAGSAANGTGNAGANVLIGSELANTLRGMAGNDRLDGGSGGADVLIGGAGNDTYVVNHSGVTIDEVADGGGGIDTILSSGSFDLNTSATIKGAVENLILTGTGPSGGFGNALDNVITGNSGNNILNGNAGNDTIFGGAGDDTITGGLGHDSLFGGAGSDRFDFNKADFAGGVIGGAVADHTDDIFDYSGFDGDVIDLDGLVGDLVPVSNEMGNVLLAQRMGSDILIQINEAALDSGNAEAPADWSDAFYIHDIVGAENTIRFAFHGQSWTLDASTLEFGIA